ncbi:MAG: phosphoribosylanthranilate isomerase [Pseudomonadota bacterium]
MNAPQRSDPMAASTPDRPIRVKICGLRSPEIVAVAAEAGAAYVGFVFYPPSPRALDAAAAREAAMAAPPSVQKVGLFVDPSDALLEEILAAVPIDILQLHGAEPPARVAEVKERFGLPVMKAIGVREAGDLAAVERYGPVADRLMVDAKPPKDAVLPGGNGLAFDWTLIEGRQWPLPWMLAGGLTAENVAEAIKRTGAVELDLSSSVESAPGEKDPDLIRAFFEALDEMPA